MSGHVLVVGGGISGLAAAEHLARVAPETAVTVVEGAERLGGCILTERHQGFVMERGPDVFLAAKPAAAELCERIGLGSRLQGTNPAVRGSYVLSRGRLERLPEGMTGLVPSRLEPFIASPLISPLGKLRVALDLVLPPRRGDEDESVESFVVRRLGREMYDRLVEPLLSGIFAGDGRRLSLLATFPQLRASEREHGGLLRAMLAPKKPPAGAAAGAPAGASSKAPARSAFLSLPAGLGEMIEALEAHLEAPADGRAPVEILRGAPAVELRAGAGIELVLADGRTLYGDGVVLATPAPVSARLLAPVDAELSALLAGIELVSTATVTLAYPSRDVPRALDATGYTVPRAEGRSVLACTWSSAKFAHRAPPGHALFRVFVGGAGREQVLERDDEALVALARAELREVVGVAAEPELVRVQRWPRTMPQYNLGHLDRLAAIDRRAAALPSIALAGNAFRGVGIPDCIRSGQQAAERVLGTRLSEPRSPSADGRAAGAPT